MNRGSNPGWGASTFLPQLVAPILLTAAPATSLARIHHIPHVFARRAFSLVCNEVLRGDALNPQG